MEGERRHYELRSGSRSRSRTPLVQNSVSVDPEPERHYNLRSHSRERSHTPGEVTSSRKSGSRSLPGSASKAYDRSMETIPEMRHDAATVSAMDAQSRRSEGSSTVSYKKTERRSERQRAKRQIFANGQSESKDDSSVRSSEEKRRSVSPRRVLTSDYSSEEGERDDPPSRPASAYEIYKQAGDWWNVFPKTDYTYSKKSQCRYEIAPGVMAMPNMSRRSIHSECGSSTSGSLPPTSQQNLSQSSQATTESGLGDTLDTGEIKESRAESFMSLSGSHGSLPMSRTWDSEAKARVYTQTHVERYKRHREIVYSVPENSTDIRQRSSARTDNPSTVRYIESRKYGHTTPVDSDAELEEAVSVSSSKNAASRWRLTRWLSAVSGLLVLWFSKLREFFGLVSVGKREYRSTHDYRRYHESRWSRVWRYIDHSSSQYVYLAMVKVFFFDSWLLSRVSSFRRWFHERGPKVLWIAFLPLLLLTGAYVVQTQSFIRLDSLRNIPSDVTETTYKILNDINDLTSLQYDSLVKYITNLKNSSLNLLSDVNASLPEMPSIGWNIQW